MSIPSKMAKTLFFILSLIILSLVVTAIQFIPQGDMNLKNVYGIINATNMTTARITINSPPAACSVANTFMTRFTGANSTCAAVDFSNISSIYYVQGTTVSEIQATINLCGTQPCHVKVPAGTYSITSPIQIPENSKIEFECDSPDTTNLYSTNTYVFYLSNNSYAHIKNCHIYSDANYAAGVRHGIYASEWTDNRNITVDYDIENNVFEYLTTAIRHKQSRENLGNIIVKNNEFRFFNDMTNWGQTYEVATFIAPKADDTTWLIENNFWHDVGKNESKCFGGNGYDETENATDVMYPSWGQSNGITVKGNMIYNVSSDGLYIHSFVNALITGNQVYKHGMMNTTHHVGIACNQCTNSVVSNNIIMGGNGKPLRTDEGQNNLFTNNYLDGGANGYKAGVFRIWNQTNSVYSHNIISSDKNPAVYIDNGSINNTVVDNMFLNSNNQIQQQVENQNLIYLNNYASPYTDYTYPQFDNYNDFNLVSSLLIFGTDVWNLSKNRSIGPSWRESTNLPSIIFNGLAADRPEISWYRGSDSYPEFSIKQHATADKGGEIYCGLGSSAPNVCMEIRRDYVKINETLYVNGNITLKNSASHAIYDNVTCTIITGDTSTLEIC